MNNQLACLRYAYQHGGQFDADVTRLAISHGAFRCALYCVLQGEFGPELQTLIANVAVLLIALYMRRYSALGLIIVLTVDSLVPFLHLHSSECAIAIMMIAFRVAILVSVAYIGYCI